MWGKLNMLMRMIINMMMMMMMMVHVMVMIMPNHDYGHDHYMRGEGVRRTAGGVIQQPVVAMMLTPDLFKQQQCGLSEMIQGRRRKPEIGQRIQIYALSGFAVICHHSVGVCVLCVFCVGVLHVCVGVHMCLCFCLCVCVCVWGVWGVWVCWGWGWGCVGCVGACGCVWLCRTPWRPRP